MSGTWTLRIEGAPVAKPRMTQRDKFLPSKAAQRYFAWADIVRLMGKRLMLVPIGRPVAIAATFHMPMPKSWSASRCREYLGRPHTQKPDIKNLVAGLEDALNGIAWRDDCLIFQYQRMEKFWTDGPGLTVLDIWTTDDQGEVIHRKSTASPQDGVIIDGTAAQDLT